MSSVDNLRSRLSGLLLLLAYFARAKMSPVFSFPTISDFPGATVPVAASRFSASLCQTVRLIRKIYKQLGLAHRCLQPIRLAQLQLCARAVLLIFSANRCVMTEDLNRFVESHYRIRRVPGCDRISSAAAHPNNSEGPPSLKALYQSGLTPGWLDAQPSSISAPPSRSLRFQISLSG